MNKYASKINSSKPISVGIWCPCSGNCTLGCNGQCSWTCAGSCAGNSAKSA